MKQIVFTVVISFLLSVILSSCKPDCKVDLNFEKKFFSCIDTIKKAIAGEEEMYTTNIRTAMVFLSAVTKKNPTNFNLEYGIYQDHESFEIDLADWENWYDNNKCQMTISKADSLVQKSTLW